MSRLCTLACTKSYDQKKSLCFIKRHIRTKCITDTICNTILYDKQSDRAKLSDANRRLNWKSRSSRVIQWGLELRYSIRNTLRFRSEIKEGAGQPFYIHSTIIPQLYDNYAGGAMQRRRSCIRATCNNAIVRTTGNNRTIYEPRGLALRMYDYRGKRCVAHTQWTSLWCTSWPHRHPSHPVPCSPPQPVITHAATVFPSHGRLWKSRWEFSRRTISKRTAFILRAILALLLLTVPMYVEIICINHRARPTLRTFIFIKKCIFARDCSSFKYCDAHLRAYSCQNWGRVRFRSWQLRIMKIIIIKLYDSLFKLRSFSFFS